jgi:RimJ/RimL family protein N-acetyltransferase
MLTELDPTQYAVVQGLFAPLAFNLVIRSVVEGHTPAQVYADEPALPRTALIWDRQDALLIAGSSTGSQNRASLREVILERIVPNARERSIPELALFSTPSWEPIIPDLLPELSPQTAGRFSYRIADFHLDPPTFSGLPEMPEGFALHRIDDGLLNSSLAHLDDVRGWIDSFWPTPQEFLHTGFGYCAISRDTIASWCLTVFAAGSTRELGLATVPEFRRQGLATRVAAACVEHALAHELLLDWHCWADNRPSALIAENIGFRLEREYSVYRLTIAR